MFQQTHLTFFRDTLSRLLALGKRVSGRKYSAAEFTRLIRRQFSATDFVFKTYRDYGVDPDNIVVAGLYDSYDDDNMLPCMTITLCYHPEQDVYFADLLNWDQFAFDVAECVGHELVHRDQYSNGRKPALKEYVSKSVDPAIMHEQNYLGSEDEIEAYGFSIAAERWAFNKNLEDCVMYDVYKTTFDTDTRIVLQLEKQVSEYLEQLEQLK